MPSFSSGFFGFRWVWWCRLGVWLGTGLRFGELGLGERWCLWWTVEAWWIADGVEVCWIKSWLVRISWAWRCLRCWWPMSALVTALVGSKVDCLIRSWWWFPRWWVVLALSGSRMTFDTTFLHRSCWLLCYISLRGYLLDLCRCWNLFNNDCFFVLMLAFILCQFHRFSCLVRG